MEDNLFQLHFELKNKTYQHSNYTSFYVTDPKLRHIHKACVKDRVLHHAIFRILYPIFDKSFIFDSYSCRNEKGTHKAVLRLETFCRKLSRNNSKNIFALKCDIKKFFDSVDQDILLNLIKLRITDENAIWLIEKIIRSFTSPQPSPYKGEGEEHIGLPLGNVTSQLFANIYLNELDQFAKHKLKIRHYLRYCDDFIILSENEKHLENIIDLVDNFLTENLKLKLHPNKIIIRKYSQGIDFLGYVVLPHYQILRTKTKKRIFKKLKMRIAQYKAGEIGEKSLNQSLQSYLGVFTHTNAYKLSQKLKNQFKFWLNE